MKSATDEILGSLPLLHPPATSKLYHPLSNPLKLEIFMKFTFSASIAAKSWIRSRRASQSLSSFSSLLSIRNHSTFNIPPRAYPYYKSMIIRSKSYSRIRGYSSRHSSNTTINPSGSKIDQQSKKPRSKTTNSILHIIAWFPVFLFLTSHVYSVGQVHGSSMSVSDRNNDFF